MPPDQRHRLIVAYNADIRQAQDARVTPEVAMESLRIHVRGVINGCTYNQRESWQRSPHRFAAEEPLLYVVHIVTTEFAARYFQALQVYLSNKRNGDSSSEALVAELHLASALLLRQVESAIPILKPPRYQNLERSSQEALLYLRTLINFDEVIGRAGFRNLFSRPSINHYQGWENDRYYVALTHTPHDGLLAVDILLFLNSASDVTLYFGESDRSDWTRIGVVRCDGRIELERESP